MSEHGAHVALGGETTVALRRIGRGEAMRVAPPASVTTRGPSVELRRGEVVEWWRALPSGLEHGVTIDARPAGDGPLVLEVGVTGALRATPVDGEAVALVDASDARVASYAHVVAFDASGARMAARMSVRHGAIRLEIDDAGATYPLVVDPLIATQEAVLVAPDGEADDRFGQSSVALSADGSRAVVGANADDTPAGSLAGSARVFVRSGTGWAQEATLLGPVGAGNYVFGDSVAISGDGSRIVVGAYGDDTSAGADAGSAYIFVRSGSSWARETILLAPDAAAGDRFGSAVAISADGTRVLIGAQNGDDGARSNVGCVHVFVLAGGWAHEAKLVAADAEWYFGGWVGRGPGVALSADGSRALIGVPGDNTGPGITGSARVFVRTAGTWTQEATLVAPDAMLNDWMGDSVSLSADGTRALVGARSDDSSAGTARVFVRSGSAWSQEASLVAPDRGLGAEFGSSVALTADASRAVIGAWRDDAFGRIDVGSVRVFVRTGTAWAQEAALFLPDPRGGIYNLFGTSVAVSADGSRVLAGAYDETARVFTLERAPNGTACTSASTCVSGHCVDGVCCDTACSGQCEACDVAGSGGTCAAVTGAPHGARAACATDGSACGGSCDGATTTGCAYPGAETVCRAGSCTSGVAILAASCAGSGSCPAEQTQACAPFLCGAAGCAGDCTVDGDCAADAFCAAGVCMPQLADGETCSSGAQCGSGSCVDDVCCASACDGQCEACDVAGSEGSCVAVTGAPHGGRPACATDGSACGGACDGTDTTACVYPGASTTCGAASCAAGTATAAGSCDGSGACGTGATTDCAPYACGTDACLAACTSAADCAPGLVCVGSACVTPSPDGGIADDAGTPPDTDAGMPETDAGMPSDAGTPDTDAGTPVADAGTPTDAATPDPDAGTPATDGGTPIDAGTLETDAGTPETDSGSVEPDAAVIDSDGGSSGLDGGAAPPPAGGCGCAVPGPRVPTAPGVLGLLAIAALLATRRR